MSKFKDFLQTRKDIAIRLLFTILFLLIGLILAVVIGICVLVQYIYLLATTTHNEALRNFSNKVSFYMYKVSRYLTLNENPRPYPFTKFPEDIELPESEVTFK
jgi:hypothetical protein